MVEVEEEERTAGFAHIEGEDVVRGDLKVAVAGQAAEEEGKE